MKNHGHGGLHSALYKDCSIIIPTIRERELQLFELLSQLIEHAGKLCELIVVSDGVNEPSRLKEIYVRCKKKGINFKFITVVEGLTTSEHRNIGIKAASSNYLIFIDDDVLPAENWLLEMRETLGRADVVGGVSKPFFVDRVIPPLWWSEAMLGFYVAVGNEYILLKEGIWSCNLGVRKEVTKKVIFDQAMGLRKHGSKVYGEDTKFVKKAIECGFKVVFNSRAIVYHRLNNNRITLKYFKSRALQEGFSLRIAQRFGPAMMLKYSIIRLIRGFRLIFKSEAKTTALPVYILLLLYECTGWFKMYLR
jgi:glycosyltransferase involved in cell wall biosynthesis